MLVTVTSPNGSQICAIDVELTDTIENLSVLLEIETGIPVASQQLLYRSKVLALNRTFADELQVNPNDNSSAASVPSNIVVILRNLSASSAAVGASSSSSSATAVGVNPHDAIAQLFGGTAASRGGGATAVVNPNEQIARLFGAPPAAAAASRPVAPPLDPMDPEYQRRLLEQIEKENLAQNFEQAMEYTPEAFARVVMLYVPCEVNKVPITAFVDSGAQTSIMSQRMAERCGIIRLLDKRMAGVAKGVGTCKILGRVHMTMVKLGGIMLPFSISVLERQDMDFLIGLDQLRRHQMCIDLKRGVLSVAEGVDVPFLGEGELPPHLRAENDGTAKDDDEGEEKEVPAAAAEKPAASPSSTNNNNNNTASAETSVVPAPAAAMTSGTAVAESAVQSVMEITGLPRVAAIGALEATGGDVDAAVSLLIE